MIYDNSETFTPVSKRISDLPGYSIHRNWTEDADHRHTDDEHKYALYTDDGRGNGDYICGSSDLYWMRAIASALDTVDTLKQLFTKGSQS